MPSLTNQSSYDRDVSTSTTLSPISGTGVLLSSCGVCSAILHTGPQLLLVNPPHQNGTPQLAVGCRFTTGLKDITSMSTLHSPPPA